MTKATGHGSPLSRGAPAGEPRVRCRRGAMARWGSPSAGAQPPGSQGVVAGEARSRLGGRRRRRRGLRAGRRGTDKRGPGAPARPPGSAQTQPPGRRRARPPGHGKARAAGACTSGPQGIGATARACAILPSRVGKKVWRMKGE